MPVPEMRDMPKTRRWVSILALVFVFFLPLHFHAAAAAANISHDCACLHGARSQTGVAPISTQTIAPLLELFVPPSFQSHFVSRVVIGFLSIRAPPLF